MNALKLLSFFTTLFLLEVAQAQTQEKKTADQSLATLRITSSIDGTEQINRFYDPSTAEPKPLLVFLHSWSNGVDQDNSRWLDLAKQRGWAFLQPDFRGKNNRPEACGSELARQDILDAIQRVLTTSKIDTSRIYLAGTSGGGHMALLMASYYPDKFSAVSSWVGISDLAKWHSTTSRKQQTMHYAKEIEACVGGAPESSDAVSKQLAMRSPINHLAKAADVPIDINTGIRDGHTGSVPVSQSIEAFNAILRAKNQDVIADQEIEKWNAAGAVEKPITGIVEDRTYPRSILFRAKLQGSRLTIFDGGHEDLPTAGISFLESVQRQTKW